MSDQIQSLCSICGQPWSLHTNRTELDCPAMGPGRIGTPRPSGLPQSELGGLHPELRARITAADAVLGDFFREHEERKQTGAVVDYVSWAGRLAGELRGLLDTIGRLS